MSEFAKQAGMVTKLLSRYDGAHPIIRSQTVSLVSRLVSYATRHLALVGTYRTLPEEHLHLLATDVAQFSLAVSGMVSLKLPELAKARQQCSSFKELLFYSHTVRIHVPHPHTGLSISACLRAAPQRPFPLLMVVCVGVGDGCECIQADCVADCHGGRLCLHARTTGCGTSYQHATAQTQPFVMCDHLSSDCCLSTCVAVRRFIRTL